MKLFLQFHSLSLLHTHEQTYPNSHRHPPTYTHTHTYTLKLTHYHPKERASLFFIQQVSTDKPLFNIIVVAQAHMSKKMEKLISREVFYVDTLHVAKYGKIMVTICASYVRNFSLIKLSTAKQLISSLRQTSKANSFS